MKLLHLVFLPFSSGIQLGNQPAELSANLDLMEQCKAKWIWNQCWELDWDFLCEQPFIKGWKVAAWKSKQCSEVAMPTVPPKTTLKAAYKMTGSMDKQQVEEKDQMANVCYDLGDEFKKCFNFCQKKKEKRFFGVKRDCTKVKDVCFNKCRQDVLEPQK